MKTDNPFIGTWHITTMDVWGKDALHLLGQPYIEFGSDEMGMLSFIAVQGDVHFKPDDPRNGKPTIGFSWVGDDDGSDASGRGWASLVDEDTIEGRIFIHRGDDSSFRAVRSR